MSGTALPDCLSQPKQCCELDAANNSVRNFAFSDDGTYSCSESFSLLYSTMETDCFANWPRSLFKMRLEEEQNSLSAINELVLSDYAGVRNSFYAMNSLVALSSAGGKVTFSSATFEYLHTCGSIVKDSFTDLG